MANYSSEREKYLATLQDEVSCGHELVSTRFQIGAKALQAIYERLGCPTTSHGKSYVDDLIWQVNDNLDGAICFEEFEKSYLRARNDRSGVEPSEIFYLTCFLMFDKECNGKVGASSGLALYIVSGWLTVRSKLDTPDPLGRHHEHSVRCLLHYDTPTLA